MFCSKPILIITKKFIFSWNSRIADYRQLFLKKLRYGAKQRYWSIIITFRFFVTVTSNKNQITSESTFCSIACSGQRLRKVSAILTPFMRSSLWIPLTKVNNVERVSLAWHQTLQPWWRHQMETFSALLALCAGNSPVTGELPSQRPVTLSFDVCFDLSLNKRLSKQSWGWWLETPLPPLWHLCHDMVNKWG